MTDAVLRWWRPPSAPAAQTVGASPWTYTNPVNAVQVVTVTGGVVSSIEVDAGAGFVLQIGVAGVFALMPTQSIRITYAVTAPSVSVVTL